MAAAATATTARPAASIAAAVVGADDWIVATAEATTGAIPNAEEKAVAMHWSGWCVVAPRDRHLEPGLAPYGPGVVAIEGVHVVPRGLYCIDW